MKKRGLAENHDDEEQQQDKKMKRIRVEEEENEEENESGFVNLDENLLYEVLKHVDARTLGSAACVSKLWHRTVQDERLWELICTKHWANIGCPNQQLRSVVLALGGFRRLHSLYLWPLLKPQSSSSSSAAASSSSSLSSSSTASSSSSSAWSPFAPMVSSKPPARWGKDEMQLSLSLLSIRYYEKMNFNSRGRWFLFFCFWFFFFNYHYPINVSNFPFLFFQHLKFFFGLWVFFFFFQICIPDYYVYFCFCFVFVVDFWVLSLLCIYFEMKKNC